MDTNSMPTSYCEYGRCGGVPHSDIETRWVARLIVEIGDRRWKVCEGCADLLLSTVRERGVRASRALLDDSTPHTRANERQHQAPRPPGSPHRSRQTPPRDPNGIPVLSHSDVEERADALLRECCPHCLGWPMQTPLKAIVDSLRAERGVDFSFDTDLGYSPAGIKYLASLHVSKPEISVDPQLAGDEPVFRFALAHEIGHYVLEHRSPTQAGRMSGKGTIPDTHDELNRTRIRTDHPRDWMEWQANRFAASLLMPRRTVQAGVSEQQQAMGITRYLGTVRVDRQPSSLRDFYDVLYRLAYVYGVPPGCVQTRLANLQLVIASPSLEDLGVEPVGQILNRQLSRDLDPPRLNQ